MSVKSTRRQQGCAIITNVDNDRTVEMDTYTCSHCNSVHFLNDAAGNKLDPGGFCMICFKQICGPCADKGSCDPFEKKLLRMEARGRFLKSVGLS